MSYTDTRTARRTVLTPVRSRPPSGPDRPDTGATRTRNATLVGIAVLVALLAGLVLGRLTSPGRPPSSAQQPGRAQTLNSTATPERSEAGAVTAATRALLLISSRGYATDPATRVKVVEQIAEPAQRDELVANVRKAVPVTGAFLAAAAPTSTSAWRLVPVGYRVSGYDATRATVGIWTVQVAASTSPDVVPATARWATATLPMVWSAGGWHLDFDAAHTDAGPSPAAADEPLSGDLDVIAADHAFAPYASDPGTATP